jgi:hypothetical protein
MGITLFVNNFAQLTLRNHHKVTAQWIPDQFGRKTNKPTLMWANYCLRNITKVTINIKGTWHEMVKGMTKDHETIIGAFGPYAREIYGLP